MFWYFIKNLIEKIVLNLVLLMENHFGIDKILLHFFRFLLPDFVAYLHERHVFPVGPYYCTRLVFSFAFPLCSTLFILSMTFDRFYSIIRPHKAAVVNTVKRAKITIVLISVFSFVYNIPQYILSQSTGKNCIPYCNASQYKYSEIYYWLSFLVIFGCPFIMLLIMNCFIKNTLRKRLTNSRKHNVTSPGQSQGQFQGHVQGHFRSKDKTPTAKTLETHVYVILLLVTFSFLILTTPGTNVLLYIIQVNIDISPKAYAKFYFLESLTEKLFYTNCGINFFLYVISGKKFRKDLLSLFQCRIFKTKELSTLSDANTVSAVLDVK